MEELKDIKGSIEIISSSLINGLFLFLLLLIVGFIAYFLYNYFKTHKKIDKRKASVVYLQGLDFENLTPKEIAYQFSKHGHITVEEHFKDEFLKIIRQLEPFKYKRVVPKMDKDLQDQMKDYIKVRVR